MPFSSLLNQIRSLLKRQSRHSPAISEKSVKLPKYDIAPLSKNHDKEHFACEEESLTRFLLSFAGQHSRRDISKTYVLTLYQQTKVLGYYTVVNSSLKLEVLPERKGYPPDYDVAAVKLARLARDLSVKGTDVAEKLIMDCFGRAVQIAEMSGASVLELDAMNHDVRDKVYAKYGFRALLDDELHLYLPMSTVRKLVALASSVAGT